MKMVSSYYCVLLLLSMSLRSISSEATFVKNIDFINGGEQQNGTKWAVLVAGSRTFDNYRHQADVCHAYQILKKGGLKDENIIVFMYDDIAFDVENPRPGVIINKPDGPDVYEGVPKDYIGEQCTADNFYAVLLGNKSSLSGGSGKVLDTSPNDNIFIYYTDHGGPGVVEMPAGPPVYAKDFVDVLKKMHEAKSYQKMVIYLEACESGSMFEGLLPENINIYATTASNASESSYGTYCPFDYYGSPTGYEVCLGDLYSISWLEDCDRMDSSKETLGAQYEAVRRRTEDTILDPSHVMQYGNKKLIKDFLISYIGSNPDNENITSINNHYQKTPSLIPTVVSQRDANLLHFRHKLLQAKSSKEKLKAQKQLNDEIFQRKQIDDAFHEIGKVLFGTNGKEMMNNVKPSGQPIVDDWDCLKMHVNTYEKYCGKLSTYGRKYMRAIANMCNAGIKTDKLIDAISPIC